MIINQFGAGSGGDKEMKTEIFTQSGTWTCPSGVEKVFVRLFGGGGGGNQYGGGGGAYMAYSEFDVTSGNAYPITIGAGGAADGVGGITSFGTLLSANGGGKATPTKAGCGGSGGGGAYTGVAGGDGSQFGGGGGCKGDGGNGGTYGGGGGAGGLGTSDQTSYTRGGNGGTYGGVVAVAGLITEPQIIRQADPVVHTVADGGMVAMVAAVEVMAATVVMAALKTV